MKTSPQYGDTRLPDRFWSKVRVADSGCWEWTASLSVGYGQIKMGGRMRKAHRLAWECLMGSVPGDLVCDHLCRNRACVNPEHIEIVPQRINVLRGDAPNATRERHAAQTHCKRGHELTEQNLTDGKRRRCRTCAREATANHRRKLAREVHSGAG